MRSNKLDTEYQGPHGRGPITGGHFGDCSCTWHRTHANIGYPLSQHAAGGNTRMHRMARDTSGVRVQLHVAQAIGM